VFHAGGDGKLRAYDEDTGKELWAGTIPTGQARGIPAMYMAGGRQYLVIMVPGGGGGGGGAAQAAAVPMAPTTPRGYIAFALPRR
jgi:glucose dehydrogenase